MLKSICPHLCIIALLCLICTTSYAQITGVFDAVNDTVTMRTEGPQLFNILRNDYTTYDFDITTFTVINPPKGTVTLKNDKGVDKLQYVPPSDHSSQDRLTYQICNKAGKCDTASVIIYKCPAGNPTFPAVNTYTVPRNQSREFKHSGYKIRFSVEPQLGTVKMTPDSSAFTYQPRNGITGCDTLKYDVYDVRNRACGYIRTEGQNAYLQIIPSNDENKAPIAQNDKVTIVGAFRTEIDVLANDSDPEGNLERKIKDIGDAKNGKIKYSQRGIITYTPKNNFVGKEEISYTVCDYNGACSSAKVLIEVKKR